MSATFTSKNPFTYLSVCSGFGGAELAFENLGWKCVAVAEIDSAARAVLKHRWPHVKNLGDFTKIGREDVGTIDALVGGTPCQSFSVAGLRGGLGDDRGNLSLEFLRLADRTRPRWILWENVPGVLSSTSHIAPDPCPPTDNLDGDDGTKDGTEVVVEDEYDADEDHAFACFLAGLSELGYGYAYRTLDAQYFGVPQRRRRVFVVGHLGDWRPAAAVLFERHSLQGNPPPSRKEGQGFTHDLAPCIGASGRGFERGGDSRGQGPVVAEGKYWDGTDTADTLDASNASNASKQQMMPEKRRFQAIIETAHSLRADGFDASEDGTGRGTPLVPVAFDSRQDPCTYGDRSGALGVSSPQSMAVAFDTTQVTSPGNYSSPKFGDPWMSVRRLTPIECERLQGIPDNHTQVPYRGKPMADGPRYKMIGNGFAIPVVRWIGERIQMVERIPVDSASS